MKNADKPTFPCNDAMGLTKREYFIAQAMQSFILSKQISTWEASHNEEGMVDDIAAASVVMADTILKHIGE